MWHALNRRRDEEIQRLVALANERGARTEDERRAVFAEFRSAGLTRDFDTISREQERIYDQIDLIDLDLAQFAPGVPDTLAEAVSRLQEAEASLDQAERWAEDRWNQYNRVAGEAASAVSRLQQAKRRFERSRRATP